MGFFSRLFQKKETKPQIKDRTLMSIKVGDMVSYNLADYEVVGKLIYNDHGYQWFEYQLESMEKTIWLNVEMDDDLECSVYEKTKEKVAEPVPESIDLDGVRYTLDEHGAANVRGEGRSSNVNGMQVQYYDYSDNTEEKYLSVEYWGTDVEVSKGQAADAFDFNIIAGTK